MLTVVWIVIAAVVIAGVVLVIQQQQAPALRPNSAALPLRRSVFTLQIGDIVQYDGADWVVEGKLTFTEDGFSWFEYLLQDGDRIRWLSVEEDDQVEVCWMETVSGVEISGAPPAQLTVNGVTYRQANSGQARMTRTGTTLNRQAQHCRYFDYEGPSPQVLSVEDWNGELEITVGQRIQPRSLSLLPGDGRRVYDEANDL